MNWSINFSDKAISFLKRENRVSEKDILELVGNAIRMFDGERLNINIKKLKGEWLGFHRIRKGDLRIIVEFDFENHSAFIEIIDWRGGAYK